MNTPPHSARVPQAQCERQKKKLLNIRKTKNKKGEFFANFSFLLAILFFPPPKTARQEGHGIAGNGQQPAVRVTNAIILVLVGRLDLALTRNDRRDKRHVPR